LAEEQSFKFSIQEVTNSSNCHTICEVHFASCLFIYSCRSQLHKHKQKLHVAYLSSWHNSIFGYELRTD